ncbi:MAG: amino acid permease [Bacillota bacterium]
MLKDRDETKCLSGRELALIGLGAIIGAGFFLASSIAIVSAGPAVLLGYLAGGLIMWQVFSALAEMAVAHPSEGSFHVYAEEALGDFFGYLSGWMYWVAGVLVMSSEVTAAAIFTQWWFAKVPLWIFVTIYSLLIIGVNSLGVKNFGRIESLFAIIKLFAVVLFILLGLAILLDIFHRPSGVGLNNYFQYGGFFPQGIRGLMSAMMMILLSFAGVVVVGMTASETINPSRDIPYAIKLIVSTLIILYIGSLAILLALVPWNQISTDASPFTRVFRLIEFSYTGSVINFIILIAALSAMNAAMYAVARVLASLAQASEAPSLLAIKNESGVPIYSLLASSGGLVVAIVMSFLLPEKVYEYLTSAAGFMLFFNWIIILASQLKYRPVLADKYAANFKFKMRGYPYSGLLTIFLIISILIGSSFNFDQLIGLIGGILIIILLSLSYFFIYNPLVKKY